MTRVQSKLRGPKALLAAGVAFVAVLAACESPVPGDEGITVTGEAPESTSRLTASAERSEGCAGECTLRVINRFEDRPVEVYVHEQEPGVYLGNVAPQQSRLFELRNRQWPHVQLSIREAGTHRFISLECVRQFSHREALAVLEDPTSRERC